MARTQFIIKRIASEDVTSWRSLREKLWPQATAEEHEQETKGILSQPERHLVLIAESAAGDAVGFAEASIRHDYVNGCDTSPVVFLEGIYVVPSARRKDVARVLCASTEQWGLSHGCAEFASDADINNTDAHTIHQALGFTEMERVVVYKKRCQPN
ncbi:aminoglycoside 6'-N-acetyltransferase [Pandoraea commovens]|uniref:Aminoglycoside N(6')-acetyltransferase type 1 n=1 Tax=Pandoraea commovens TaxID=2508289 RepID=A0ABY5QCW5_9BURK|nr:aminoglycoside 6'-N-acetyltransferase [Pandoraea commovens]UVA78360.1 GNAT family N-acetyltransferase [Pandoraea commovens]